jgi:predicted metal-binding membrane protein
MNAAIRGVSTRYYRRSVNEAFHIGAARTFLPERCWALMLVMFAAGANVL